MTREVMIFRAEYDPNDEPIPFRIEVFNAATGEKVREEDFLAIGDPGAGGDIAAYTIVATAGGQKFIDLAAIMRFFERVLPEPDYRRLESLVADKVVNVKIGTLMAVYRRLTEIYASNGADSPARPTVTSNGSSNGQQPLGVSSTALASSTA